VLDDPKRFFAALSFSAAIGLAALAALLAWAAEQRSRVPASRRNAAVLAE
jgi:hypothetical protein